MSKEVATKLQFGSKSALFVQDSYSAQNAYSHSSMSFCAKNEPAKKSSNLASKASFVTTSKVISLLFVCMGNICRSPALAATFMQLARKKKVEDRFFVDSSALTTFYLGQPADYRMTKAAKKKGILIEHIAQLFEKRDFSKFDYILAVNHEVKDLLQGLASTPQESKKIILATAFSKNYKNEEIADPYFHGGEAFDHVMEMALDSCEGLLEQLMLESKIFH